MNLTTMLFTMFGLALLASVAGLTASPTQHSRPASIENATIDDLAWIAGRWHTRMGEDQYLQETWGEPVANAMTGMFTWQRGEANWLYEFLLIEQTEEGITYYLRHFGPGSKGWESKDEPLSFPLKSLRENEATFENPERNDPRRFIFARDGDRLAIHIESQKDGETKRNTFRYQLVK